MRHLPRLTELEAKLRAGSPQDEEQKVRTKWVPDGKGKTRDEPDESEGIGGHVKMAGVAVWPCVASGSRRNHGAHP